MHFDPYGIIGVPLAACQGKAKCRRALPRLAAALYLVAIMVGAVHLGWHYALDCYAGFIGAALIYGAVGAMQRWHGRATVAEPAAQPVSA